LPVEGFSAAIDRASAYHELARTCFSSKRPTTENEIAEVRQRLPGWKPHQYVRGRQDAAAAGAAAGSPWLQRRHHPSDTQRGAIKGHGNASWPPSPKTAAQHRCEATMVTFKEREAGSNRGTAAYLERDKQYGA